MSYFQSIKAKQIVAVSVIVLLGTFLFYSLLDFLPAFLGAIIFYIISTPAMDFLHIKMKFKKGLSAIIVLLASLLIIMIPAFSLGNMLISKLSTIINSSNTTILLQIEHINKYVKDYVGYDIFTPDNLQKVQELITNLIPNLLNQTVSIIADIVIMYFIFFYLLYSEFDFKDIIARYLPYKKENTALFAKELTLQTYSNVIGAPLLAIIQGVFAVIGFAIFDLNEPFFWGVMCGFLSFIPFVGTALIWIPAGIIQLSMGEMWQGVGILVFGALVITNVDNVFRFILQKKIADVHPLVTVFGVIIGLKWFGLPGLIFGPILISYFFIMIKIFRLEYGDTPKANNTGDNKQN